MSAERYLNDSMKWNKELPVGQMPSASLPLELFKLIRFAEFWAKSALTKAEKREYSLQYSMVA